MNVCAAIASTSFLFKGFLCVLDVKTNFYCQSSDKDILIHWKSLLWKFFHHKSRISRN